jgi:hypothetical protein
MCPQVEMQRSLRAEGETFKEREMNHQEPPDPNPAEQQPNSGQINPNSDEQRPRVTRPLRGGPHEQARWRATLSQSMQRLPPRWRKPWLWAVAGALLVLCIALFFGTRSPSAPPTGPRQTAPGTLSFSVGSRPALVFAHSIGNVHIRSGPDGQVSITENRNGFTDAIHIRYQQNGDTIHVTSDIESDLASDTWVDFDVRVPRQAGLSAALQNGGTLEADGLSGQIALSNTNGSIWATNDSGSISARTQSGSINLKGVSGQVTLATQNGTITTSNTQIGGRSTVQAETGTINFHGSLARDASALFKDTNGQVSLNLPRSSAFQVHARTGGGAVNTDFPGITIRPAAGGNEASGVVGKPPRAQLTIQTTSGPVLLHQEG